MLSPGQPVEILVKLIPCTPGFSLLTLVPTTVAHFPSLRELTSRSFHVGTWSVWVASISGLEGQHLEPEPEPKGS